MEISVTEAKAQLTDLVRRAEVGALARPVMQAYESWGRGAHLAALSFGDGFAYVAARQNNCALLFVGSDFSRTDIPRAI